MAKHLKGPNEVPITIKVPEPLVQLLDGLAAQTERTRSSVTRMLIMKGLRLYERDGTLLDVPIVEQGARVVDLPEGRTQPTKKTKIA